MTQTSPIELGAEIVSLTDQTFERVRPRVEHYALDERRRKEDGGLLLSGEAGSSFKDPANHYGHLALKICDRKSKAAAWKVFEADVLPALVAHPDEIADPNYVELNEQIRKDKDFRPKAAEMEIRIARDRYPRGGTNYNRVSYAVSPNHPWMFDKDFDLEDWGDRHKVAVETEIAFTSDASDLIFRWRTGFILQNRFDRPTPQGRLTSQVDKLQKREGETPEYIEWGYPKKIDDSPDQMDIDSMKRMIALAKDLRPIVHHPDVNDRRNAELKALWDGFINGEPTPA